MSATCDACDGTGDWADGDCELPCPKCLREFAASRRPPTDEEFARLRDAARSRDPRTVELERRIADAAAADRGDRNDG